jgi:hypothetical protein
MLAWMLRRRRGGPWKWKWIFAGSAAGTGGVDSWGNEDGGGRRRGRRELGGKGWLAGGQETCASAALLGEDKRRWLGFRGEGMCLLAGCRLSAFGS